MLDSQQADTKWPQPHSVIVHSSFSRATVEEPLLAAPQWDLPYQMSFLGGNIRNDTVLLSQRDHHSCVRAKLDSLKG